MATLTVPITLDQLLELIGQLSSEGQEALAHRLLSARFDTVLSESDRLRPSRVSVTDEEIQAEVEAVRRQRRQERLSAPGG